MEEHAQILVEWKPGKLDINGFAEDLKAIFADLSSDITIEISSIQLTEDKPAVLLSFPAALPMKPDGADVKKWFECINKHQNVWRKLRKHKSKGAIRFNHSLVSMLAVNYIGNMEKQRVTRIDEISVSSFQANKQGNPLSPMQDWKQLGAYWFTYLVDGKAIHLVEVGSNGRRGYYLRRELEDIAD